MSSFIFSGGVEVLGFISPTDTSDEYAVIDPLYGIDGLRNVSSISELNAITTLRRRPGMVVGVNNGSQYYKLNPTPWNGTLTDWSLFTPGIFTGGTVSGETNFTSGVTATIFSAGTYLNLPIDNTVTGGTYNPSNGSVTFTNNTGGTFTVTGFITGFTDIQVTGYTYSANTFTIYDSSGNTFSATINSMTGLTVNGVISATTISATTYQNLPSDIIIVNSTPIQSGFTGGVLFQSSANTVTQTTGFTWDNTNKRLGIGVNSPLYNLDVNGAIYQRTGELLITSSGGVNKEGPFIASSGGDDVNSNRTTQLGISDNLSVPVGIDMFATNNSFPSSYINFRVNNADLVKMSGSSVGIGTTIDDRFRLYVSGDTRINGGLTATTISATTISASTYQNLPITTLTVNSTPISGGTSGRVFFQNSANTLSQSSDLFWDNANGRLGVGTSSPGRPLTVVNSILGVVALFGGQNAAPSWVGIGSVDGGSSPFIQGYDTSVTGTTKLSLNANGSNVLIGTTTDAGFRLDVNGTARIQNNFTISSGFSVINAGNTLNIRSNLAGGSGYILNVQSFNILNGPNTEQGFGTFEGTYAPTSTSGSPSFNALKLNITINQTGGASGTTRGLYINPTLTSAFDWRSIEWSNNTGWGLYGTGIANNYLGGRLGIRTTNPQALLNVANTGTTGTTALFSGAGQNVVTIVGSGSTQPIFTIQGSSGELFSVTDSLTGSLFSVNDISGLPILEVFSNNTTLMGSYLAPSLNTTAYVIASIGTTNVYSIPTSAYTGAFFDYTVSDGTNLRAGNIMSIWSGTSVNFTETSTTDFGNTSGLTFNMVVSSGNAILRTSGTTGNWTVKTIVRSI